jgi:hypothetical protein
VIKPRGAKTVNPLLRQTTAQMLRVLVDEEHHCRGHMNTERKTMPYDRDIQIVDRFLRSSDDESRVRNSEATDNIGTAKAPPRYGTARRARVHTPTLHLFIIKLFINHSDYQRSF